MTIYILGDTSETVQSLDDKSLNLMISDIAQVLCNAHYSFLIMKGRGMPLYHRQVKNIPLNDKFHKTIKKYSKWSEWAIVCISNYNYLSELGEKCCMEYINRTYNYGDENVNFHKMQLVIDWAQDNFPCVPHIGRYIIGNYTVYKINGDTTPFPYVMPKKYIASEFLDYTIKEKQELSRVVNSYRMYYKSKLKSDVTWTHRNKPEWIDNS